MAKNSFEPILPFQLFIYELGGTLLDYASSEKDLGVIVNTTLQGRGEGLGGLVKISSWGLF